MDITRSFIETAVDKGLRDIQRDPERSIRNLVDLGQNFSRGRFQKHFLTTAQTMLRNRDSAYYTAAKNAVAHVDHAVLKSFGINLGYNSFTRGAKEIRRQEASLRINIPWTISLEYGGNTAGLSLQALGRIVSQGRQLGIMTYIIFCHAEHISTVQALFAANRDCAFVLYVQPSEDTPLYLASLSQHKNIMVILCQEDAAFEQGCAVLRQQACLYGTYGTVTAENQSLLMSAAWLERAVSVGCIFGFLLAAPRTTPAAKESLYQYVCDTRGGQHYPIFLMDYYADVLYIDHVISEQSCFMGINAQGQVYTTDPLHLTGKTIQDRSLLAILRQVMPRVTYL